MEEAVQNQIIKLATLKLKPYRKFIKKLLKIEEQGLVLEKDYRKLCALFRERIMLYMEKEYARSITANLIAIGRCVGLGNENSRLREELREPVMAIINMLMKNMGFGGELDTTIIEEWERAENEFFPQLFRQAVKEALDNVLVNRSDYCLLNRGEYVQEKDGEYIVFSFINDHPLGCRIMIGPFIDKADVEILFRLYVPRYIQQTVPELAADNEISSFVDTYINNREMPLSISRPLQDSCLIELQQEDSYKGYISSFSFGMSSSAPYRCNYAEIAFVLGQRVKDIFLHAAISLEAMHLYEYITRLEKIDPFSIYPSDPWKLTEDGDIEFIPE